MKCSTGAIFISAIMAHSALACDSYEIRLFPLSGCRAERVEGDGEATVAQLFHQVFGRDDGAW